MGWKRGRLYRVLMLLLFTVVLTGCGQEKEAPTVFGTINDETVYVEDAVVILQQKRETYEQQMAAFQEQFPDEQIDRERLNENFKEEAYEALLMDYLLAQYALQQEETLSREQQQENEEQAAELFEKLSAGRMETLHFTKSQIQECLNHSSLAGIYFGNQLDIYEAAAKKELLQDAYESEEEYRLAVQSQAYRRFQEEYQKQKEQAVIRLDQKLWEQYCAFFLF